MKTTQLDLFDVPTTMRPPRPRPAPRDPFADAATVELSDAFLDHMDKECADCIDENGVTLPWLLRQLRQSGASRVTFI